MFFCETPSAPIHSICRYGPSSFITHTKRTIFQCFYNFIKRLPFLQWLVPRFRKHACKHNCNFCFLFCEGSWPLSLNRQKMQKKKKENQKIFSFSQTVLRCAHPNLSASAVAVVRVQQPTQGIFSDRYQKLVLLSVGRRQTTVKNGQNRVNFIVCAFAFCCCCWIGHCCVSTVV